jgi:hypothetical protein
MLTSTGSRAAALVVLLVPAAAAAERLPAYPYEQLPVTIYNLASRKCLDITGAGGPLRLVEHDAASQRFQFVPPTPTAREVWLIRDTHSGLCLTVPGWSPLSRTSRNLLREGADLVVARPAARLSPRRVLGDLAARIDRWLAALLEHVAQMSATLLDA